MHKELIICIAVIISVIIINFITQSYAQESVNVMDEGLNKLEEALKNEDITENEIQEKMDKVMENWKDKYEKLAFFIEHDELEKVETELTSLRAHISTEEYEDAVEALEKSIFILNHIKEKFRLNMKNIF